MPNANVIERYLSLSPGEQSIVRSACAAPDPVGSFSLLRLYFPQVTMADVRTLKEYVVSQKPPA
jgi:hypothetical protein